MGKRTTLGDLFVVLYSLVTTPCKPLMLWAGLSAHNKKMVKTPVESTANKRDPKESLATLLSQRGFELVSFWERNPEAD